MRRLLQALWRVTTVNGPLKLLSFALAVSLWMYVSLSQTVDELPKTAVLELRNLPPDLVRVSDVVSSIDIKLRGPNARLRSIEPDSLSYELDLAQATSGRISYKIIDSRFRGVPSGVQVVEIVPSEISISFAERIEKELPVEIVTQGDPAFGYLVDEKVADPKLVKVSGAIGEVANMNAVQTEVVNLAGRKDDFRGTLALNLVGRHVTAQDVQEVEVWIRVVPDVVQRTFEDLPILVENAEWKCSISPPRQTLRLKGPSALLQNLDPAAIQLVVDAAGLPPGEHRVKPAVRMPDKGEVVPFGADLPEVILVMSKTKSKK